jgi:predicted transcriptional regulator
MTQLLQQALATVSALPDARQDEIARVLLQLAGLEQPPYLLSPEEEADLDASIAEAGRGEFATDEEVAAVWARFRR